MCTGFEWAMVAAATTATAATIHTGEQQKKAQEASLNQQRSAQAEAKSAAETQAKASDEAMNKANRKSPDMVSIMEGASKGGQSATMLTGAAGVNPNDLNIGKNTLLGG